MKLSWEHTVAIWWAVSPDSVHQQTSDRLVRTFLRELHDRDPKGKDILQCGAFRQVQKKVGKLADCDSNLKPYDRLGDIFDMIPARGPQTVLYIHLNVLTSCRVFQSLGKSRQV